MKKFIVIYQAPSYAIEGLAGASAEEIKKALGPFREWAERCGSALVDMGSLMKGGQNLSESGSLPGDQQILGYSILQAEDMEAAKALLQGHPHITLSHGCEIEVYESIPISM